MLNENKLYMLNLKPYLTFKLKQVVASNPQLKLYSQLFQLVCPPKLFEHQFFQMLFEQPGTANKKIKLEYLITLMFKPKDKLNTNTQTHKQHQIYVVRHSHWEHTVTIYPKYTFLRFTHNKSAPSPKDTKKEHKVPESYTQLP